MSAIGPGSLGAVNLAGSFAGAQRNAAAESGQTRSAAAERQSKSDLKALASKSLEDVGETDQSADRDADGRMPFAEEFADEESQTNPMDADDAIQSTSIRAPDAVGERGGRLDLDA